MPIRVREKRGSRIAAVGQESLVIRAIIIVFPRLRYVGAIECDVILTEQ